ncbi:hypothetical protein N9C75_02510, partial [Alphaproteobacteria bacterium]|nr:hypothetical protein [Alphaproteobacteria bacterium]
LSNVSPFTLELLKIFSDLDTSRTLNNIIIQPWGVLKIPVEKIQYRTIYGLKASHQILDLPETKINTHIIPISNTSQDLLPELWNSNNFKEKAIKFGIEIDDSHKVINFGSKNIIVDENFFIPSGYKILGYGGLEINLVNGASIYSKSPFNFLGNEEKKIKIFSAIKDAGGLVILDTLAPNFFKHTLFEGIGTPDNEISGLTASITVYNSEISFTNCLFALNQSEDFLNVVNSSYKVVQSKFEFVFSDALDSDFSSGEVLHSSFINIGNDALDFSGSNANISFVDIKDVGDKALSAGEKSTILLKNIKISGAEIGLASKDLSEVAAEKLELTETRLGFAVYQKKPEFGPANMIVEAHVLDNIEKLYMVDVLSSLSINEKVVKDKILNVEEKLYGVEFGKSSKE